LLDEFPQNNNMIRALVQWRGLLSVTWTRPLGAYDFVCPEMQSCHMPRTSLQIESDTPPLFLLTQVKIPSSQIIEKSLAKPFRERLGISLMLGGVAMGPVTVSVDPRAQLIGSQLQLQKPNDDRPPVVGRSCIDDFRGRGRPPTKTEPAARVNVAIGAKCRQKRGILFSYRHRAASFRQLQLKSI